jgi:hypothetical protein
LQFGLGARTWTVQAFDSKRTRIPGLDIAAAQYALHAFRERRANNKHDANNEGI